MSECMPCNPILFCVGSRTGLACGRRALAVNVSTAPSRRRCARNKAGRAEVQQAPGTRGGVDPGPISLSLLCFRSSIALLSDCKAVLYRSKFSHRVMTYSTPYPPWVECCEQPTAVIRYQRCAHSAPGTFEYKASTAAAGARGLGR